jgi:hypothetical protein
MAPSASSHLHVRGVDLGENVSAIVRDDDEILVASTSSRARRSHGARRCPCTVSFTHVERS